MLMSMSDLSSCQIYRQSIQRDVCGCWTETYESSDEEIAPVLSCSYSCQPLGSSRSRHSSAIQRSCGHLSRSKPMCCAISSTTSSSSSSVHVWWPQRLHRQAEGQGSQLNPRARNCLNTRRQGNECMQACTVVERMSSSTFGARGLSDCGG